MKRVYRGRRSSLLGEEDRLYRLYHDTGTIRPAARTALRATLRRCPPTAAALPPYLARARRILLGAHDIATVARRCGVARSTAWSYATVLAQEDEAVAAHVLASTSLLCPELVAALRAAEDTSGPLSALLGRLEESLLRGDVQWRCEDDRFSQLRLARICLASVGERVLAPRAENAPSPLPSRSPCPSPSRRSARRSPPSRSASPR